MKVLVVGGGGREHALAWALGRSPRVDEVVVAPGNAGIAAVARTLPVDLAPASLLALAQREAADLTVVGPEVPLVAGVADAFEEAGLALFGPHREAARLEGSKRHAKAFMTRHAIPTAAHRSFTERESALRYLAEVGAPVVVKDSRLAGGKGVTVAEEPATARRAVERLFEAPGAEVVIEERLVGQEVSLLLFTDGRDYRPMLLAQDYKQLGDGDVGAMTGGMGTVAPAAGLLTPHDFDVVLRRVVEPTLAGLAADGVDYRGVLFIGLMLTDDGAKVLEYNVRFGDPETQVVLPLLETDLLEVLEAVVGRRLGRLELRWREAAAACVVMAAPGYPGAYRKGIPIAIPDGLEGEDLMIFHAGTRRTDVGLVSAGGRVLGVTGRAPSLEEAIASAYRAVERIDFPGARYRRDVGGRLGPAGRGRD